MFFICITSNVIKAQSLLEDVQRKIMVRGQLFIKKKKTFQKEMPM